MRREFPQVSWRAIAADRPGIDRRRIVTEKSPLDAFRRAGEIPCAFITACPDRLPGALPTAKQFTKDSKPKAGDRAHGSAGTHSATNDRKRQEEIRMMLLDNGRRQSDGIAGSHGEWVGEVENLVDRALGAHKR